MLLAMAALVLGSAARCSADLDSTSLLTNVSAVEGQTAELPCDVTPPIVDDELRLVLWYYGTEGTPVYTYDVRNRHSGHGSHWADASVDRGRVRFQPDTRPAHLRLGGVRRSDQRLYRCRVDFLHSPTRNSRVNLTVITPPGRPTILDDGGHVVERLTGRRYREGELVQLTCRSSEGTPPPNITWWQGAELLDSSWHRTPGGSVENVVTIGPLTREDLGQEYVCWASNHVLAPPRSTGVTIDMLLRPLSVRLLGSNNPLSAGVTYQLTCQSAGSRPAAVISWWKDGQQLTAVDEVRSHDGNVTTSRVSLRPEVQDAGRQVRCRAHNPLLSAALEDVWRLNVRYAPVVRLRTWSSEPGRPVREGHDVYMKCIVKADPPALRLVWKLNGVPVVSDPRRDLQLTNDTLVLHHVTRNASGDYSCSAFNAEGTGESAVVRLRVRYAPRCAPDQVTQYGASRGETIYVRCHVTAEPPPFRFSWAFNASGHMIDVPESHAESTGLSSLCRYTPRTALDYGRLLCWAENEVARQREPCAFRVVPAERPDGLNNCTVVNSTSETLHVHCTAGYNGGLRQTFVLEMTDIQLQRLVTNISSDTPRFVAQGLRPGRRYLLAIYAVNKKGRGDRYITTAVTPEDVAQRIIAEDAQQPADDALRMTPLLGALLGVIGVLVLVVVVIVVGIRVRARRRSRRKDRPPAAGTTAGDTNNQLEPDLKQKASTETLPLEYLDPEEKHMIERLSQPSSRTLRPAPGGYGCGHHGHASPPGTTGRVRKSHPSRPASQHLPGPDVQYASVPCLARRSAADVRADVRTDVGPPPHAARRHEIEPFLPRSDHRESSV